MNLNEHEKWIKNQLEDKQFPVDTNALWGQLESHVPQKRKRKPLILILLLTVIAVLSFYVIFSEKDNSHIAVNHQEQYTNSLKNESPNLSKANTNIDKTANQINTIESSSLHHPLSINHSKNNTSKTLILDTKRGFENNKSNANDSKELIENTEKNQEYAPNLEKIFSSNSVIGSIVNKSNEYNNSLSEITLAQNEKIAFILQESHLLKNIVLTLNNQQSLPELSLKQIQKKAKTNKYFISGTIGSNSHTPTLYHNEESGYGRVYNSISAPVLGFSSSIHFDYKLTQKWSIQSGILYDQLVSRLSHSYNLLNSTETVNIQQIIIDNLGNENENQGKIKKYTVDKIQGKWYQYNNQVKLSLGINYNVYQNNRWRTDIGFGTNIILLNNYKGSYLTQDFSIEKITTQKSISTNNGLSPYIQTGIYYKWNRNTEFGIRASYSKTNSNYLNIIDNTSIKNHIYNLGLSCRYGI